MTGCELLQGCLFFNDKMADMPSTAEIIKLKFCQGNNAECARYQVYRAFGRERVPRNLFPNQLDDAQRIIREG